MNNRRFFRDGDVERRGAHERARGHEPRGLAWCRYPHAEEGTPVPLFLEGEIGAEAELKALTDLGSGGTWVLRQILARAESHPGDERVPEALSLAIKAVRRTCHDNDADKLAEKAFRVLHRRYGKTQWARETQYWYRSGS